MVFIVFAASSAFTLTPTIEFGDAALAGPMAMAIWYLASFALSFNHLRGRTQQAPQCLRAYSLLAAGVPRRSFALGKTVKEDDDDEDKPALFSSI